MGRLWPFLDAGKIAAQQPRSPLDIALREASLAAITPNYFANIDLGLLFWHKPPHPSKFAGYITQWSEGTQEVSCWSFLAFAPPSLKGSDLITRSSKSYTFILAGLQVEHAPLAVNGCKG